MQYRSVAIVSGKRNNRRMENTFYAYIEWSQKTRDHTLLSLSHAYPFFFSTLFKAGIIIAQSSCRFRAPKNIVTSGPLLKSNDGSDCNAIGENSHFRIELSQKFC